MQIYNIFCYYTNIDVYFLKLRKSLFNYDRNLWFFSMTLSVRQNTPNLTIEALATFAKLYICLAYAKVNKIISWWQPMLGF